MGLNIPGGIGNVTADTFSGDGSITAFTLSTTPATINNTYVFIDGVYQFKSAYSLSSTTLTFTAAPANGTSIQVLSVTTLNIGTPADGTVTTAKLASSLTLTTPNLGTPTAGVLTSCTALPLTTGVTGILPIANGGTNDSGTAWTSWSPTVTSQGGSITSYVTAARYKTLGKTVFYAIDINITNGGTATGACIFTLPVNAQGTSPAYSSAGRETNSTGKAVTASVISATQMNVVNYDNTTPIATNHVISLSGVYESA